MFARARRYSGPILLAAAVGAACCTAPSPAPPPSDSLPPGMRPGAFSWREVRGGQDKLEAFKDLRDRSLAVLTEAARFPGHGGAPSPAARELAAVNAAFDESQAPEQLEARIVYFDRERDPPTGPGEVAAEGIEISLRRVVPHGATQEFKLVIEDLARDGAVDGRLDRISLRWYPARLSIDIEEEGGQPVEEVRVADAAEYRVTSPHLGALFARAQTEIYKPLSGSTFARAVREGTAPLRFRPSPPQGTSFGPIEIKEAN